MRDKKNVNISDNVEKEKHLSLFFENRNTKENVKILKTKHCKWFPVCPMKYYYEQGKLDKKWIEKYCQGDGSLCVRYQMEEEGKYHPDWMLPDGSLDEKLSEL